MSVPRALAVDPAAVLQALKEDLLPEGHAGTDDSVAVAAHVLRRLSGIMCPCSQPALLTAAKQSLDALLGSRVELSEFLPVVLEDLLVGGDLIELARVAVADLEEKPTWLFCAPPSFLQVGERVYVFGVAPDDAPFLPSSLLQRLGCDGATRFIDAESGEDLETVLTSLGLRQWAETTWLTKMSVETPASWIDRVRGRLAREGVNGRISEVSLLQHAQDEPKRYRNRWNPPGNETGLFVGRAPQQYGAPLWYAMTLQNGQVERSLLLPFSDVTSRACDLAWRTQLAIDAFNHHPATYSVRSERDGHRIHADFPLPLGAKRRLLYLGGMKNYEGSVDGSFWVPATLLASADQLLQSDVWLCKSTDQHV